MSLMSSRDEYDAEMSQQNFTRAAFLADDAGLEDEAIGVARDAAFKQFVGAWFNFRGAVSQAKAWDFDQDRVTRLCNELIAEIAEKQEREGREQKVFDVDRMDHTSVSKLVASFRDKYRRYL